MSGTTLRARLLPAIGVAVFCLALWLLHEALREYRYQDVVRSLRALPASAVLLALGFSALAYLALTGYDVLALRYVGKPIAYARAAFASFIAYAVGHSLGMTWLTVGSVRYRLYSGWGLTAGDVAAVVAFCALTFWLGFSALAGAVLLVGDPPQALQASLGVGSSRPLGVLLLSVVGAYLALGAGRRRTIRVRQWELPVPGLRLRLAQVAVSGLDWAFAAGTLYVLLPPESAPSYPTVLLAYLLAVVAGLVSQVPGGIGVLEGIVLLLVPGPPAAVLGSLVAYRALYYLVPLLLALVALAAYEAARARERLVGLARTVGQAAAAVAPQVLAFATFVAGVILLVSGATPAERSRLGSLERLLPLPVVETSHFLGSLAGLALLFLARGLQLRLDAAYGLSAALLGAGAVLSLLKGLDYEEAAVLTVMLMGLLPARRHFYRRASLMGEAMSPWWVAAIAVVLIGTAALGLFAYKHVGLTADLWWRFALEAEAPRSLRATVGAAGLLVALALTRLFRPAAAEPGPATAADLDRAAAVVARSRDTLAHLALLGDKSLLFSESGRSFLMYGVERTSRVAMGDPVGPAAEARELVWRFREMSDRHGGWAVFYQVRPHMLPVYLDLGLTALELGEEARVSLEAFSLDGRDAKGFRDLLHRAERAGARFEVVPAADVPALLPDLRAVSDRWLGGKGTRERGFALGFFDPAYLARGPVAIVRREGRVVAFANLWLAAEREDLAADLVRDVPGALDEALEYLFLRLMLWGRAQRFRWFDLGMAPLARPEDRALAPLWSRAGASLFRHGEHFDDVQGLRRYRAKFDPVWEPRYLAAPSGLALPRVLTDIATLVAGPLRRVAAR